MEWIEEDVEEILDDNVLSLQDILAEIVARRVPSLEQLKEFLQNAEDRFIVENGRVALFDPDLVVGRERAVSYFENELDSYIEPPNYMNFRGHIGQADDAVKDFINSFYPRKEFRNFLLAHPDVFVVFDDDTVFLIEKRSVNYFKECLQRRSEGMYFMNLRGHLGQAPDCVIQFIRRNYPGENFSQFLENNSDVFHIDDDDFVFLNENDED